MSHHIAVWAGCLMGLGIIATAQEPDVKARLQAVQNLAAPLPEGTRVVVTWHPKTEQKPLGEQKRVQLPLVTTGEPGSIELTNERVHEILDEEEIASLKVSFSG